MRNNSDSQVNDRLEVVSSDLSQIETKALAALATLVKRPPPNIDEVRPCQRCGVRKNLDGFHKNASKRSGHESVCKVCDSKRKKKSYKQNKKIERDRDQFASVVIGSLTEQSISDFAKVLGPAIKECVYGKCG